MTDPIKRLNYFNHQFLTEEDFKAEQEYHMRMRRFLNKALYTPGVISDLTVKKKGEKQVTVSSGIAIDSEGREIVQLEECTIDLSNLTANSTIYITIAYHEEKTDLSTAIGIEGYTRCMEEPKVISDTTAPDKRQVISLAQFTLQNGSVPGSDGKELKDGRQMAGVKIGGDLTVTGIMRASSYYVGDSKDPFQP